MKFITSVSMPCTREQYEADLKKPLEEMGYKLWDFSFWSYELNQYIINCYAELGAIGNIGKVTAMDSNWFYFIPTYNPEFFLALAAMTDEPRGIKGEWWKIGDTLSGDALLRLEGQLSCIPLQFPRKATKEEIIKHFTNMKKKQDLRELLQSGNIVEFSDGETGIVIDTPLGKLIQFAELRGEVENLNEDLGYVDNPTWKIVRIRKVNYPRQIISKYFHEAPIIWERKEVEELTIDELIEKAGYKKGEIKVKVE